MSNVFLSLFECIVTFGIVDLLHKHQSRCALEEIHYHSDDFSNSMITSLCLL